MVALFSWIIHRVLPRRLFLNNGIHGPLAVSLVAWLSAMSLFPPVALGVPEVTAVKVTDVTASSFSMVWMTDVEAQPWIEVYSDSSMTDLLNEGLLITPMPGDDREATESARRKGIMKVRVSGLEPSRTYYVRAVTIDPSDNASVGYSALQEITTSSMVKPFRDAGGMPVPCSNDLVSFRVYIRPSDPSTVPGLGDLIILEMDGAASPLSAFVGDGAASPDGIIDLNNLFDTTGTSLDVRGGEHVVITVYREGTLSVLTHYRIVPADGDMVYVVEPLKGFFADLNLDGKVDDLDFGMFRRQYRTLPDDVDYNPDFDFVADEEGRVDAREFSRFAREYGRTDVE